MAVQQALTYQLNKNTLAAAKMLPLLLLLLLLLMLMIICAGNAYLE